MPSDLLNARKVDHDLIGGAWQRLVYRPGRPEGMVDKSAYTMCVLEQFHRASQAPRHLRRRLPAVARPASAPAGRAEVGVLARIRHERALNLPADPTGFLADRAGEVDAAYPELVTHLGEDSPARIDDEGKLHVAALEAKSEPASLVDLRRRVEAMLPEVDLPELVMEVMSWHPSFCGVVHPRLRRTRPRRGPGFVCRGRALRLCYLR
jgi:hypothetical protein